MSSKMVFVPWVCVVFVLTLFDFRKNPRQDSQRQPSFCDLSLRYIDFSASVMPKSIFLYPFRLSRKFFIID